MVIFIIQRVLEKTLSLNYQPTKTFFPEVEMKVHYLSFSCLFCIQSHFSDNSACFFLETHHHSLLLVHMVQVDGFDLAFHPGGESD